MKKVSTDYKKFQVEWVRPSASSLEYYREQRKKFREDPKAGFNGMYKALMSDTGKTIKVCQQVEGMPYIIVYNTDHEGEVLNYNIRNGFYAWGIESNAEERKHELLSAIHSQKPLLMPANLMPHLKECEKEVLDGFEKVVFSSIPLITTWEELVEPLNLPPILIYAPRRGLSYAILNYIEFGDTDFEKYIYGVGKDEQK